VCFKEFDFFLFFYFFNIFLNKKIFKKISINLNMLCQVGSFMSFSFWVLCCWASRTAL